MNGKDHSNARRYIPPASSSGFYKAIQFKLFLFVCLFLILGAKDSFAQQINLQVKKEKLEQVIKLLRSNTDYSIMVTSDVLEKSRPVSVNLKNVSIEQALKEIFKDQPASLRYEIKGKNIIIKEELKKNEEKPSERESKESAFEGTVTDIKGAALSGVTVLNKQNGLQAATDETGYFRIPVRIGDLLQFRLLGYEQQEITINDAKKIAVSLYTNTQEIDVVDVVNTGYQSIPKERVVGSYVQIDNKLLNRSVSTNILDRLNGIVPGLAKDEIGDFNGEIQTNPNNRSSGLTIRGKSTFLSSTDPLIVVDNFPFEGELSSINPNDIENITILKDASAASIWGARSGNGVIVITTKRGKQNEAIKIDFSSNVTVADRPDVYYNQNYIDSKSFIDIEQYLFNQGYFDSDLMDNSTYPVVSSAVETMNLVNTGALTDTEGQKRLDVLRNSDVRKDWSKYIYQKALKQQYSLAMHGGTSNITYRLSAGYDKNKDELVRNGSDRLTINTLNTYRPIKNLEIIAGLNYAQSHTDLNNRFSQYAMGSSKYSGSYLPYSMLADDSGNFLSIPRNFRESYLAQTASQGFRDWQYIPLQELAIADNRTKVNSILAKLSASYKIIPELSATVNYQIEEQKISSRNLQTQDTYYVRNLYNKFSVYNASTKTIASNFPKGGVLDLNDYTWTSWNFRSQLNYNKTFGLHGISALAGFESRELKTDGTGQTLLGYDDQFGTSNMALDYVTSFPTTPTGSSRLPSPTGRIYGIINRFLSYYANGSYNYNDRYTVTASVRTDGANLFGAKVNNRFTPLWSVGAGWKISNESFYKAAFLPYLNLRASYGFNGNTYRYGTALLTGRYGTASLTGAPQINNLTAPNPELSWERVKNLNLGIDFKTKDNVVSGTIEFYNKTGIDLVQPTDLAPQTGFATYTANTAKTRTKGLDLNLTVNWLNKDLQWKTIVQYSLVKDKILKYDAPYSTISGFGGMVGRPLNALFAYKWEGLNPESGNPVGWYEGAKSEDYAAIVANLKQEDIVYTGNRTPTSFGSFRNDFSYKGFDLSFNITYFLDYVFRRSTIDPNYSSLLTLQRHTDYFKRWQQPGDEQTTSVPSLTSTENYYRSTFYQLSEALITPGDHIRLQDIRLGYDLNKIINSPKIRLNAFFYANNIGIIWRKNKNGLDPSVINYPIPRTYSIGINANF
ncbi:SusC/RagA family TonB-linked outer membrane protein [uncultured Dysgonomonas sp.]|uniref:SusC/RagA family TonB-linked outer membrane protein n=1 Tax=uncultured Dysgonomonas sp. TaxID=206096 RepID=UPI000AE527C5|nr:SusC/RagA family TonB-linked outer membrane protein [uncultured Dysgonomonas sp.]